MTMDVCVILVGMECTVLPQFVQMMILSVVIVVLVVATVYAHVTSLDILTCPIPVGQPQSYLLEYYAKQMERLSVPISCLVTGLSVVAMVYVSFNSIPPVVLGAFVIMAMVVLLVMFHCVQEAVIHMSSVTSKLDNATVDPCTLHHQDIVPEVKSIVGVKKTRVGLVHPHHPMPHRVPVIPTIVRMEVAPVQSSNVHSSLSQTLDHANVL